MKQLLALFLALLFVGPNVAARAQNDESCGPQSGLCWPVVKRGASGPRVVALQFLLRNRGYKVVPDGKFAFATESAVRKFQRKNKLQVDGKIGWQSWEALTPNLKRGAKGDAVRALQTLLVLQGEKVKIDGVLGSATQRAVDDYFGFGEGKPPGSSVDDEGWCALTGGQFVPEH